MIFFFRHWAVRRLKGFLTSRRSASPTRINSLRKCSRKSKSSGVRTIVLINWTQATFEKYLDFHQLRYERCESVECVSDSIESRWIDDQGWVSGPFGSP